MADICTAIFERQQFQRYGGVAQKILQFHEFNGIGKFNILQFNEIAFN